MEVKVPPGLRASRWRWQRIRNWLLVRVGHKASPTGDSVPRETVCSFGVQIQLLISGD